jgi:hypothetical protein
MRKRLICTFLALASLLALPALAGASASSTATAHTVKLQGMRDGLWTNSSAGFGFIWPGDKIVVTGMALGTIGGQPTGEGAFYENLTATSPWPMAKGSGAYLFPNGTITFGEQTVKNTPSSYILSATVTGGTGAYQNATGTLTISGKPVPLPNDEKQLAPDNVTGTSSNTVAGTLNY